MKSLNVFFQVQKNTYNHFSWNLQELLRDVTPKFWPSFEASGMEY